MHPNRMKPCAECIKAVRRNEGAHFVVEGVTFSTVAMVHSLALKQGFNGGRQTTWRRLREGATTWAELVAPVYGSGHSQAGSKRPKDDGEIMDAIDAVEARKRAIAAAQSAEEEE